MGAHKRNVNPSFEPGLHPIDTISYGVQDLVYTRWSCVDMASIEKHALAEFLRWSLWRTRPSSAATEGPADTRSSVSPSSVTRDKLLADSPSLSPTPFRCFSAATTWQLSSDLNVVFCELQFCKPVILILFTLALQVFSKTIKSTQKKKPTKFAIDLRTPEEIEQDLKNELDTECWDFVLQSRLQSK